MRICIQFSIEPSINSYSQEWFRLLNEIFCASCLGRRVIIWPARCARPHIHTIQNQNDLLELKIGNQIEMKWKPSLFKLCKSCLPGDKSMQIHFAQNEWKEQAPKIIKRRKKRKRSSFCNRCELFLLWFKDWFIATRLRRHFFFSQFDHIGNLIDRKTMNLLDGFGCTTHETQWKTEFGCDGNGYNIRWFFSFLLLRHFFRLCHLLLLIWLV